MKPVKIAFFGLGAAALLVLAGCDSPESRIQAACMKGGLNSGSANQPQQSPAEVKRICECFTKNVKQSMTPAELKMLADRMSSPKKEDQDFSKMPPEIGQKAIMATKSCAMT